MTEIKKNGCYNRPPFKNVVEWKGKPFPFTMSRDCQYSKTTDDVSCEGCVHKSILSKLNKR